MAHAFSDEGRKYAVRMLAKEVAAIEAERDQLRAQVEALKAERNAAGMKARNDLLMKLGQWKAYAERLEEAGRYMASQSTREDANRWQNAKETKP